MWKKSWIIYGKGQKNKGIYAYLWIRFLSSKKVPSSSNLAISKNLAGVMHRKKNAAVGNRDFSKNENPRSLGIAKLFEELLLHLLEGDAEKKPGVLGSDQKPGGALFPLSGETAEGDPTSPEIGKKLPHLGGSEKAFSRTFPEPPPELPGFSKGSGKGWIERTLGRSIPGHSQTFPQKNFLNSALLSGSSDVKISEKASVTVPFRRGEAEPQCPTFRETPVSLPSGKGKLLRRMPGMMKLRSVHSRITQNFLFSRRLFDTYRIPVVYLDYAYGEIPRGGRGRSGRESENEEKEKERKKKFSLFFDKESLSIYNGHGRSLPPSNNLWRSFALKKLLFPAKGCDFHFITHSGGKPLGSSSGREKSSSRKIYGAASRSESADSAGGPLGGGNSLEKTYSGLHSYPLSSSSSGKGGGSRQRCGASRNDLGYLPARSGSGAL